MIFTLIHRIPLIDYIYKHRHTHNRVCTHTDGKTGRDRVCDCRALGFWLHVFVSVDVNSCVRFRFGLCALVRPQRNPRFLSNSIQIENIECGWIKNVCHFKWSYTHLRNKYFNEFYGKKLFSKFLATISFNNGPRKKNKLNSPLFHPIQLIPSVFRCSFQLLFFQQQRVSFFSLPQRRTKPITYLCTYILFGRCVCVLVGRALCVYVRILVVSPMQAHEHHINGLLSYMLLVPYRTLTHVLDYPCHRDDALSTPIHLNYEIFEISLF